MKRTLLLSTLFFSVFTFSQSIDLELLKDGFTKPLSLQNAGDERLFVVEQNGKIKIILPDNTIAPTPFLDISSKVSTGGERGLLGLAFHPNYISNGFFYINYTDVNGNTVIARYQVSNNPNEADSSSELILMNFSQPASNHNGGDLAFGPDGYLYISSGDGGEFGDPNHRAQSLDEYLGKILRIDVDNPSGGNNYGIPNSNPFVNSPDAKPEVWAFGLRNPWRFSIDETTDEIWIADVGQADIEEINKQSLNDSGLNYGWRCYEGSQPFNLSGCPNASELTFPFSEYTHDNGNCSITGGIVYRGSNYPQLQGLYFFADYCSGMIGTVDSNGTINIAANKTGNWVSFGTDVYNELYIVSISDGKIYKIKDATVSTDEFQENKFTVYPNPALNNVFISHSEHVKSITILNVFGQKLLSPPVKKEIDVSMLSAGTYFLRIQTLYNQMTVRKLIVK